MLVLRPGNREGSYQGETKYIATTSKIVIILIPATVGRRGNFGNHEVE